MSLVHSPTPLGGVGRKSGTATQQASGLPPLTERLLKCDFIALDALKKKVNDPLTNMILDELPEFIEKHFKP